MSAREGAVSIVDKRGRAILRPWVVGFTYRRRGVVVLGVAWVKAATERGARDRVRLSKPGADVLDVSAA